MHPFLTRIKAGPYHIEGASLGGVYTSLRVPELGVLLDVGMPIRSFAGTDTIFLSHGHGDHAGSLFSLLGMRGLLHKKAPARVFAPSAIVDDLRTAIDAMSRLQRHDLAADLVPVNPGDEVQLRKDLWVRAFRTHHPVPSLGYLFFDRVQKLKAEFADLPGQEIGERRRRGEDLFDTHERHELAYATDTLIRVLDTAPAIKTVRTLILECTFLDERKPIEASRAGCHIHMDELLERAHELKNETIVLMHFSQLYSPKDVHRIVAERWPKDHPSELVLFAPKRGPWF